MHVLAAANPKPEVWSGIIGNLEQRVVLLTPDDRLVSQLVAVDDPLVVHHLVSLPPAAQQAQ